MKIRKTYQGTIPENKVEGSYTESDSDVYSCNYVNNVINGELIGEYSGSSEAVVDFNNYREIILYTRAGEILFTKTIKVGNLTNINNYISDGYYVSSSDNCACCWKISMNKTKIVLFKSYVNGSNKLSNSTTYVYGIK